MKNIPLLFKKNFGPVNVKGKLLIAFFVLIFTPLAALTFISYRIVSDSLESQVVFSASQALQQANSFLSYKINYIINASDIIYFNNDVQEILRREIKTYSEDIIQQGEDARLLTRLFSNLQKNEDIYRIRLYVRKELTYSDENINFFSLDNIKDNATYKKLKLTNDKVFWLPPGILEDAKTMVDAKAEKVKVVSVIRGVRNSENIIEFLGIIRIDILESNIRNIINDANTTKNGFMYLMNSDGELISSSKTETAVNWIKNQKLIGDMGTENRDWQTADSGKGKYIVGCKDISNTDWKLFSVIPLIDIKLPGEKISNQMLVLMLIIGAVSYIIAYYISSYGTNKITQIINSMKKVQNGEFEVIIPAAGNDEIGQLVDNFNFMVKKIGILIKEQYKSGQEVKNAELKALQAQINPHFLYNTLDLINWMSTKHKVPDIGFIVHALAKFYKLSLSKGRDIVSIRDEIEHVKIYVQIQNLRFDDSINLQLDIDEKLYDFSMLKIILQPLVENSILHGILNKEKIAGTDHVKGTVSITGRLENDIICLCVRDDGIGISEEKMEQILQQGNTSQSSGYGVFNINERIRLHYSSQYGLTYKSISGQGTVVEIRIPTVPYNFK